MAVAGASEPLKGRVNRLPERHPLVGREIQEELRLDQLQLHDREPAVSVADHVDTGIDGRRRHRRQRGFGEVSRRGACVPQFFAAAELRSEEHTSELQSLMRTSYA